MIALLFLIAADTPSPSKDDGAAKPMVAPTITAAVEPREAEVGDTLIMRITVKHAEADNFEFPNEADFSPLELNDKAATQSHDGPMVTEEMVFKLSAFETGEQTIPSLSFKVGGAAYSTDALTVQIKSTVGETKGEPARKPDGAPLAIYERLLWPFYALAGALFGAAAYLLWRRRKMKPAPVVEEAAPEIPPHEAALMLFKLLRQKDLLGKGAVREFYFEATEILRAYLSQRYAVNALDLTTSELIGKLSAISAPGLDREALRQWLDQADLVKFAKLDPPLERGASMLDFFEAQVWATRPPAPKAVVAGAA